MTFGSLFAGIGGIDLGLERAGLTCRWQVEIDDYANKVLEKHWPDVPRYRDIKEFEPDDSHRVEVLAGGFPCQDVSQAGRREGIDGKRSGLWSEYARIIRILRPRFVFVENVPGLFVSGLGRVLGDLAESGYDAEWQVLSAKQFGAPHLRRRVFIVARNTDIGNVGKVRGVCEKHRTDASGVCEVVPYTTGNGPGRRQQQPQGSEGAGHVPDTWATEPDVGRVAHGVPQRVDRLKCLGNAVVPQCAEYVGRMIINGENDAQEGTS